MGTTAVFYILLPLEGLAERFRQLEEPDFIRLRRTHGTRIDPYASLSSREGDDEPDFYIRSWDIRVSTSSGINTLNSNKLNFHELINIMDNLEANGSGHIAKSINLKVGEEVARGIDTWVGFGYDTVGSQSIHIQVHQNLQSIMGTKNQILAVCHYPWPRMWVYEDQALPTIMLLRKVVEILQPDFGWHGSWESVCDAWHLDNENTDEPATPLTHDPAPWRTYRRACVFGPSLQARLRLEDITYRRYGGIFSSWRDGNMLWFRSPSGFDIVYGAHKIQVDDPNGTWWMHLSPRGWQTLGNINDLFYDREKEHEATLSGLISGAATPFDLN